MTGIAILGAGRWGVHLIRNFLEHPNAQVVAISDSNPERLAAISDRFDLDTSVVLTTGWSAVRVLPQVQAVAIATPATTHYPLIADALKRGFHVLSEKPLTLKPEESIELCHLAEQHQRQLVVDHTYLFHPAVRRGQKVVRQGTLGELRYGYAARTHLGPVRQDVDALWDLAIHDIAIFNTWLGEMPTQVQGTGRVWLQPNLSEEHSPLFPQGLSDLVGVTLTYASGFQALIHLCWFNADKQRRLAVVGSQGTLIFDEMETEAPLTLQRGQIELSNGYWMPKDQSREVLDLERAEPLKQVCHHFLDCVQQKQPSPISSGWVGADLVKVLWALTESIQQGGKVVQL